jgi:hypothetical protein
MIGMPGMYAATSMVPLLPPGLCDEVAQPCSLVRPEHRDVNLQLLVQLQLEQRQLLLLRQAQLHAALNLSLQALYPVPMPCPSKSGRSSSSESTASGDTTLDLSSEPEDAPTTVIMKKMPKAFTATMLLQLLDSHGFQGAYDFLYAPVDFERMVGTGCSFINFRCHEDAIRFMTHFQGFHDWNVKCGGTKRAELSWSVACQGRQAHIERYRNSPVMHALVPEALKPMLFDEQGNLEPFPLPTEIFDPPRAFEHLHS